MAQLQLQPKKEIEISFTTLNTKYILYKDGTWEKIKTK